MGNAFSEATMAISYANTASDSPIPVYFSDWGVRGTPATKQFAENEYNRTQQF
jgi:hypothetical protein